MPEALCQKNIMHELYVTLDDRRMRHIQNATFLRLIFNKRLTYRAHVKQLKYSCTKSLNWLRILAHNNWGADGTVLLRLYQILIRSKLDYQRVVYGGAAKRIVLTLFTIRV